MRLLLAVLLSAAVAAPAAATPAKHLFGAVANPSVSTPAPFGAYNKGCLAGAAELAETGPAWQAMRLSRNRNWGHPDTIALIARLSENARRAGWPGLLVGDISQPRGGPMTSGHASHQIGLDADIWLTRAPERPLSRAEREEIGAMSVVADDRIRLNDRWTPAHHAILKAAASDPAVARIFVNPAIKQRLCEDEPKGDRAWLRQIRPWWGHDSHFHVRLACPPGAVGCADQDPPPPGDGCDASLAWWFSDEALNPKPPTTPAIPRPDLTMADLPAECRAVLEQN